MPSESPEDKPTPPQAKSRQERIRDNQRRSRARRQEYLADLEKRLSECQITCRDADIHKTAFLELQIENTRLRELLALAGVNDHFVEHYVSQAVAQATQFPQGANPALRQLKPKIASIDTTRMFNSTNAPTTGSAIGSIPHASSSHSSLTSDPSRPTSNTPPNMSTSHVSGTSLPDQPMSHTPSSSYMPISPFAPQSDMNTSTDFDWLYQQNSLPQAQSQSSHFVCEAFGVTAQTVPRVADDQTILCSVAKQMIDQYHIPPAEMAQVKSKLSTGMCQPPFPGSDCSVDNQVLFQVLNELSSKYS